MRKRSIRNHARPYGFTIVEVLTVLAILLILLGLGIPAFRGLIESQRLTAAANEFMSAIHLARAEAIHRGERVDLAATAGDWGRGWAVFIDRNGNLHPDDGDAILYRHALSAEDISIQSRLLDNSRNYLAYSGSGRSRTDASAQQPQFGTIRFRVGKQGRNIVLNMVGRPRICTPAAGSDNC